MSSKLEGIDHNGMRSAPYKKLDTSAISKIKINQKCSVKELGDQIKEMFVNAVDLLYGTNKDQKYIKISDLFMLRVRGALAELYSQLQKDYKDKFNADSITSSLNDALENSINKAIDDSNKTILNKIQDIYSSIIKIIQFYREQNNQDISYLSNQIYDNEGIRENSSINGKENEKLENIEDDESTSFKNLSDVLNSLLEQQRLSYDFLINIQLDILTGFDKLNDLISSISTQNAVNKASYGINDKIRFNTSDQNKVNEKSLNEQIGKIDYKTKGEDIKAIEESKKKENDVAQEKTDKKREKSLKKRKSGIKNILTGKQFDKLMQLLNRQFFFVTDYSDFIMKKINKHFVKINSRLDKLIKDKNAHGFSWGKLLLFLSLFLIPFLWDKITDLITYLDKEFQIEKKIEDFIGKIQWSKHIASIGSYLWDAIVNVFNKFIKNPFGWIIDKVKKTYDLLVGWVKDIWKWVTGEVGKSKKIDKEQAKIYLEEEKKRLAAIKKYHKDIDEKEKDAIKQINMSGKDKIDRINKELDKINSDIKQTGDSITTSTREVAEKSTSDLNDAMQGISPNAEQYIKDNAKKLEEGTANVVNKAADSLRQQGKEIADQINKDGSPTGLSKANLRFVENGDYFPDNDIDRRAASINNSIRKSNDMDRFIKLDVKGHPERLATEDMNANFQEIANSTLQAIGKGKAGTKYYTANKLHNAFTDIDSINGSYRKNLDIAFSKASEKEKKEAFAQKIMRDREGNTNELINAELFESTVKALNLVADRSATIDETMAQSNNLLNDIKTNISDYWKDFNAFIKNKNAQKSNITNNIGIMNANSNGAENAATNANMK